MGASQVCDCAERAAEEIRQTEMREARSDELAEAEAFSPLRIRPYVTLDSAESADAEGVDAEGADTEGGATNGAASPAAGPDARGAAGVSGHDHRPAYGGPLPPAGAEQSPQGASGAGTPEGPGGPDGSGGPGGSSGPGGYGGYDGPATGPQPADVSPSGGRRRRTRVAVAVGTVVVAGAAVALFASGVFSTDAAVAEAHPLPAGQEATSATAAPARSPSATASSGASPSVSSSATAPSASATSSPTASADSTAASATPSGSTAALPPSAPASHPAAPTKSDPPSAPALGAESTVVLHEGDSGPAVTELQQRLKLVNMYSGEPSGQFDARTERNLTAYQWTRGATDEHGVYGPDTRTKLEGETSQLP